jgi:hypothetical protein
VAQSFLEVARELIDSPEAKAAYADSDAADAAADDAFGTGADEEEGDGVGDEGRDGEESADDGVLPGAQPDAIGAEHELDHELDELEGTNAAPLRPVEPPEEPVEDEFEEMI